MIINELFNTKINPNTISNTGESIEKAAKFILKNCTEFLKLKAPGKFLFRGDIGDYTSDIMLINPRIDRKSNGLDNNIHTKLIKCFKLVGFSASRNKTISCISDIDYAMSFGDEVYIVFPLNGFDYTWSTKFDDIGAVGHSILSKEEQNMVDFITDISIEDITKKIALDIVNKWGFTNKNLAEAMIKKHEVAIAGKCLIIDSSYAGDLSLLIKNI